MKYENVNTLNELIPALNLLKEAVSDEFKQNLKSLFEENPTLASIKIRINNHEFNDGDTTYFGFYYDDVTVTDSDGNEHERNNYSSTDKDRNRNQPLVKAVYDLFEKYDILDNYETLFGDAYERIVISRASVATTKFYHSEY